MRIVRIWRKGGNTQSVSVAESTGQERYLLVYFRNAAEGTIEHARTLIAPNSLLLCGPEGNDEDVRLLKSAYFWLQFDTNKRLATEHRLPEQLGIPARTPLQIVGAGVQDVEMLCTLLANAFREENAQIACSCEHLLYALLYQFSACAIAKTKRTTADSNTARLLALRERIYRFPERRWSLEEMCRIVNISRTHLQRIYHETFDTACYTDVLRSKLQRAKSLLEHTNHSVRQIAQECGFENEVTFMRSFKKQLGYTPSTYRNQVVPTAEPEAEPVPRVDES